MLLSSYNTSTGILLPQLSPPPPAISLGNNETLLHYDNLVSQYNCLLELQEYQCLLPVHQYHDENHTAAAGGGPSTTLLLEKRDGHSKIFTAQGPRDRRVRLSKDVARKFFDLQDFLGFDRASKTLDWLLKKSKPAIKELMIPISARFSHMYPSSESENLESSKNKNKKKKIRKRPGNNNINLSTTGRRKSKLLEEKLNLDDQMIMKEMRAKARARARERTKEKQFLREMMIINKEGYLQQNLIMSRESSSNFSHCSPNTTTTVVTSSPSSSSFLQYPYPFTNFTTSSSSPGTVLQVQRKPFDLSEYNSNNNHGLMWS